MNLANYKTMDPMLLYSMVNMALRDSGDNLSEFCKQHEIDEKELVAILQKIGFTYMSSPQKITKTKERY